VAEVDEFLRPPAGHASLEDIYQACGGIAFSTEKSNPGSMIAFLITTLGPIVVLCSSTDSSTVVQPLTRIRGK
jgi:hypothetical protein